ncbi:MAG: hypothetical protein HQM13_10715 [SAR324 cluster bacterium]|nr:hypothetical protein [SAR324 cluster bacterium]
MNFHVAAVYRFVFLLVLLGFFPFTAMQALELSGAATFPSGGIINSLYISGTPIDGLTLKVKTENDIEYTAFFGGASLVSIEKIDTLSSDGVFGILGSDVYAIHGVSLPLYLNFGGGFYLIKTNSIGLRLQYVTLVGGGGTILGSKSAGPSFVGWLGFLLSYKI